MRYDWSDSQEAEALSLPLFVEGQGGTPHGNQSIN